MKNEVHCPNCGSRLLDAEKGVKTLTKIIYAHDTGQSTDLWVPDYYEKCWKCKQEIGIKKQNK